MNKKAKTLLVLVSVLFLIPSLLAGLAILCEVKWYLGVIPYFISFSPGIGMYIIGSIKWGPWWLYD